MIGLVYFLIIGLAAGWLAGQFTRRSSSGLATDLIVGVVGSLLGGFLFRLLGLSASGLVADLVVATVGAILLLYLVRQYHRRF